MKRIKKLRILKYIFRYLFGVGFLPSVFVFGSMLFTGIIFMTTVSSYYFLNNIDEPNVATESQAKVKEITSKCTCSCGCRLGNYSNCTSVGSNSVYGNTSLSVSGLKFSGSLDKSNVVNQIFFLTNDITYKLGVPIWLPYATVSVETGGSIYVSGNLKIRQSSTSLDSITTGGFNGRKADMNSGAAGWFQVEGVSVANESGHIAKDTARYQNMLQASGIDVSKYPGMSSALAKEASLGHKEWYWDCEYYPAAIVNFCLSALEKRDIVLSSSWLNGNAVFQSYNQQQKDLVCYFIIMTLHNNGNGSIKAFYEKDEAFFNYLRAFVDVMTYKSAEFANQNFRDTWGNASYSASTWVINNTTALSQDEKNDLLSKLKTLRVSSKDKYSTPMLGRFCNYGTNGIYNAISRNGSISALGNLAKAGINIEEGWFNFGGSSSNQFNGDDDFALSNSSSTTSTTTVGNHLNGYSNSYCTCKADCSCGCPCSKFEGTTEISAGLLETKGIPQGIYSDLNGNSLSGEDVMNMFKASAPNMAEYYKDVIGISPKVSTPDYWVNVPDKFAGKFGDNNGIIHYTQHRVEPYGEMKYIYGSRDSDGFTSNTPFVNASCGFSAISIVSSTMLHRYITPPEVIMASYLSPKLNNSDSANKKVFIGNVLNYNNADAILDTFRFRGKKLFETSIGGGLVQSKLDDTLDSGGMVIMVTGSRLWTFGGHYIVIRERDSNGKYYTVDSSVWALSNLSGKPDRPCDFTDFSKSLRSGQIFYIKPGDGYNDYIEFYKSGESSYNSPNNGSGDNLTDSNGSTSISSGTGIYLLDSGFSPDGKPILQRDIDALHKAGPLTLVTEKAISRIGGNYLWGTYNGGGNNFDCSGLVSWAFKQAGYFISGSSRSLAKMGRQVSLSEIQPGDLVFYSGSSGINHVTMYIGGGYVVSASGQGASATPDRMGMYSDGKSGVRTHVVDYRPITTIRRLIE